MKPNRHRSSKLVVKAKSLLQNNKMDDALAVSIEASKLDSANADAWFLQAVIYAKRQDYSGIAQCCIQVIKQQPNNAAAYYNLGLAQQFSGNLEAAVRAYREAIRLQPGYTAAQANLAAVLIDVDQADEALELVETVLLNSPAMIEAISIKGTALLHVGKPELAMDWLANARSTMGDLPALMYPIACCHEVLGNADEAYALLVRLTETSSQFAPGWAGLGRLTIRQERFAEAARYYGHAVRLQPTFENRFNLAHCLYASDNSEAARRLYHDLLDVQPDNPLVHNNLGRLYEKIGNIRNAELHFRCATELQPGNPVTHCNYGRILLGVGRLDEAQHEFDSAIAIEPANFEGHHGRGQVMCELGRIQEAVESFQVAVRLKPELADAKYYIASLGGEEAGEQDRQDYVAGLFDKYADKFDAELITGLKYKTPEKLLSLVQASLGNESGKYDMLDLGCGTGLCGQVFRPFARKLVGVDLSSRMIEKARERSVYDELAVADVTTFMKSVSDCYDLIIAGDVFVYIGDLSQVFEAAQIALRHNGYFAFSTEKYDGSGFTIRGSGRHAHSSVYINYLAQTKHFTAVSTSDCDLRLEYGKPVRGTLYVFRLHE